MTGNSGSDSVLAQNMLMFFGAMGTIIAFWLLLLGVLNSNWAQLGGGVLAGAVAAACFRGYANVLRKQDPPR